MTKSESKNVCHGSSQTLGPCPVAGGPIGLTYNLLRPVLFKLDPETAHNLICSVGDLCQRLPASYKALSWLFAPKEDNSLAQKIFGREFRNPIGVAAGFDKNAHLVDFVNALGFGFLEAGSVTYHPSKGNPKPRLFRLPDDQALINRMGLNNDGPDCFISNLEGSKSALPVGVNITKTHDPDILGTQAIEDFSNSYQKLFLHGAFTVLNVSCPNTREGKTFENPDALSSLLAAIDTKRNELSRPLLVKLSPDLEDDQFEKTLALCEDFDVSGYVIGNTTNHRDGLITATSQLAQIGNGGLSGHPLFSRLCTRIERASLRLEKKKPIIAAGGIFTPEEAYKVIGLGASLIEVYTSLVYRGPNLAKTLAEGLGTLLKSDGHVNISQRIGASLK